MTKKRNYATTQEILEIIKKNSKDKFFGHKVFGFSKSNYYRNLKYEKIEKSKPYQDRLNKVAEVHHYLKGTCGSQKINAELKNKFSFQVSDRTIRRDLNKLNIQTTVRVSKKVKKDKEMKDTSKPNNYLINRDFHGKTGLIIATNVTYLKPHIWCNKSTPLFVCKH